MTVRRKPKPKTPAPAAPPSPPKQSSGADQLLRALAADPSGRPLLITKPCVEVSVTFVGGNVDDVNVVWAFLFGASGDPPRTTERESNGETVVTVEAVLSNRSYEVFREFWIARYGERGEPVKP